tara:strand:- start:74 stop:712 length:639 start_codon:yes stop_codon:yes gene_type:complete
MNIFNTIFNLGVLFAVYGFIWFFIDLLMKFIISNRKQKTSEIYFSKAIKYIFLANVTFLFGLENNQINWQNLALSGLILLLYFIEKLQKNEKKAVLMNQFSGFTNLGKNTVFNRKAEIIVISISITFYSTLIFLPELADNPISTWFYNEIINIENLPLIGFIFKVIGFFFLLGILIKITNSFMYLLSGDSYKKNDSVNQDNDNSFDDYEEIN